MYQNQPGIYLYELVEGKVSLFDRFDNLKRFVHFYTPRQVERWVSNDLTEHTIWNRAFVVFDHTGRQYHKDHILGLSRKAHVRCLRWWQLPGNVRRSRWHRPKRGQLRCECRWMNAWDDEDVSIKYRRRKDAYASFIDWDRKYRKNQTNWKHYRRNQWK